MSTKDYNEGPEWVVWIPVAIMMAMAAIAVIGFVYEFGGRYLWE